jgi:hypothetical protein
MIENPFDLPLDIAAIVLPLAADVIEHATTAAGGKWGGGQTTHPTFAVGYILWEDVLRVIAPDLLEVAVDELVHVSTGLRFLREWQKEHRAV